MSDSRVGAGRRIAAKVAAAVVAVAVVVGVNRYLVTAYWQELVVTAVVVAAMTAGMSRLDRRARLRRQP
ncbi:hypothetical protein CP980_34875 [Streptomyces vinaceus]|uniref:Uncharacterized protein n=1 Tax=Streptomyces vinaceus TaxID=1960 RepID=A0A5J6JHH6_STRVI|nr:hypothetical protein [Streptomyces vinaceus]QEV49513.1 hypothetical protein CP980_34875 [Streptomyces vinaceus]GHE46315.1 hypothetical protein GCM10017778_32790 [Streptomyces vinaceus]